MNFTRNINNLKSESFDLLVIGGGIYGAWAAYDAAMRGLKVAIIDKGDWGGATSQSSSKLAHGGLRYLEYGHLGLVKKSLRERNLLLRLGPHRIYPLDLATPLYKNSFRKTWQMKFGLWIYDLISDKDPLIKRHRWLDREKSLDAYPFLLSEGLKGTASFTDCGLDDFRYALEIVYGAVKEGARAANYVEAREFNIREHSVKTVGVIDQLTGDRFEINSSAVILAAGPWVKSLCQSFFKEKNKKIRLSKGVHLVMPDIFQGQRKGFLLPSLKDKRFIFILPWYGRTLLGTTDTDFTGSCDDVRVTDPDIDYLLEQAAHYLPGCAWSRADIHGVYAGVRTLKDNSGHPSWELSRDWVCENPLENCWVSIGGKLTAARVDCCRIVDAVLLKLGKGKCPTRTHGVTLPWAPSEAYIPWCNNKAQVLMSLGVPNEVCDTLLSRYGTCVDSIIDLIKEKPSLGAPIVEDLPFVMAEVVYAARHEMSVTLEDILRRRIPLCILTQLTQTSIESMTEEAAEVLKWDYQRRRQEAETFGRQFAGEERF